MAIAEGPMTVNETAGELYRLVDAVANEDFSPALDECYPLFQADIEDHFNAAEGPASTWPLHAPSTIERYGHHPLLIMSGDLAAAATGQGSGHVHETDGRSMKYGVSKDVIPYAGHDHGFPELNIPQREYMWIREETADECVSVIYEFMEREIIG